MRNYLDRLISDALAIEETDAKESGALGYMARIFTQASLPHRKIIGNEYRRDNGVLTLTVMSPSNIGVPYGSYPRLLMSWLTTEASKTKNPTLVLGSSLNEFMAKLGLIPTGGRWGTIPRLKEQMMRIFSSSISCQYHSEDHQASIGLRVAKSYDLWWSPKTPNQEGLWKSTVTLSQDFFCEIVESPVPIDLRVLKAIKQSAMKLDIYCWLTYRMSYLKKQTEIPWSLLQIQFGSDFARPRDFKNAFIEHMKGVLLFYDVNVEVGEKGLILKPSKTHILKKSMSKILIY